MNKETEKANIYEKIDAFSPNSRSNKFRGRRFETFIRLIDNTLEGKCSCRILDIGGTVGYWKSRKEDLSGRNVHVTIVNHDKEATEEPWLSSLSGDARNLCEFQDMSFDIVHSNSVIEHVGLWRDMCAMGREVQRLAPKYFVQTPNYWFPVEPHFRALFLHWLPDALRLSVMMNRRDYPGGKAEVGAAMTRLHSTILLDRRMLATIFPDAKLVPEKFFGLTKSWMAVRLQ